MPITKNESAVVSVPSAYIDGEVTFCVMLQISIGTVLLEPTVCRVRGELVIGQSEAEQRYGDHTRQQDRQHHQAQRLQRRAPRSLAASS